MVISHCACAQDTCIDPSTLTAKTVSITRYFTDDEKRRLSLDGYRATAWFYGSTRYLVSIAHFVDDAPVLPRGEWTNVDVQQGNVKVRVNARLLTVVKALPEGFALFEASDLTRLGRGESIARIGGAANDFTEIAVLSERPRMVDLGAGVLLSRFVAQSLLVTVDGFVRFAED